MSKLLDFVRKKVLGHKLYNSCKYRTPQVMINMLEQRLQELHNEGLYKDWNLEDMIRFCKIKKSPVFAMDKFIQEDYVKPLLSNIEEEEYEYAEPPKCNIRNVLEILHQVIIGRGMCFLQGAFVFADKDGKLFNLLTTDCNIGKRVPVFRNITHSYFLDKNKFNKINAQLDEDFAKTMNTYFPYAINNIYEQYETHIQDKDRNPVDYDYACDVVCRDKPKEEEKCPESLKATKRVILYYPFQVTHFISSGNFKKRYLYLKLEETPAISLEHVKSALEAYIKPKTKVSYGEGKNYFLRRERKVDAHREQNYKNTELYNLDNMMYSSLNMNIKQEEINLYNNSVRSHYEMYIPQELTNFIITEAIKPDENAQ